VSVRAGLDRSVPPRPQELRPYEFPDFIRHRLPDGLTALLAPMPGAPLLSVELAFPAGGEREEPQLAGLASLTAGLLDEGTDQRDALAVAAYVERLGGQLSAAANWDLGALELELLPRHRSAALELLAEVARSPRFDPEEFERARRNRVTDLLRRRDRPGQVANDQLLRALFGPATYGLPLEGTPESIERLTREDVLGFYERHYGLADAVLLMAGDFDPADVLAELAERFAGPTPAAPPRPRVDLPPESDGRRVVVVDRSGSAQTELRLGHLAPGRLHPDWSGLAVLNTLFGGKFTSRINLNLREVHGYTYGASSRFASRLGPGYLTISAAVATPHAGAAVREILSEMDRLRNEPIAPEELAETRSYLLGVFPYTLQTTAGVVQHLESLAIFGFSDDYYRRARYLARLEAVTLDQLSQLAQRHIRPEQAILVAVGPATELVPQLEGLGTVEVVVG
jgi:zinc protease